jgi:hypothetical protein
MFKKPMSMLFVELQTCLAFFALGDVCFSTATVVALFLNHSRKSYFRHPL